MQFGMPMICTFTLKSPGRQAWLGHSQSIYHPAIAPVDPVGMILALKRTPFNSYKCDMNFNILLLLN